MINTEELKIVIGLLKDVADGALYAFIFYIILPFIAQLSKYGMIAYISGRVIKFFADFTKQKIEAEKEVMLKEGEEK